MTATNRFERVDERQDDAVSLNLLTEGGVASGFVLCPGAIMPGIDAADQISPTVVAKDAFRTAIRLANEIKAAVVVIDPERLWQSEWGSLFRVD